MKKSIKKSAGKKTSVDEEYYVFAFGLPHETEDWLNVKDVADVGKLTNDERDCFYEEYKRRSKPSRATAERWVRTGVRGIRLKTVTVGGRRYTTENAIRAFLADQQHTEPEYARTELRRGKLSQKDIEAATRKYGLPEPQEAERQSNPNNTNVAFFLQRAICRQYSSTSLTISGSSLPAPRFVIVCLERMIMNGV